jgi:hypothetical protein
VSCRKARLTIAITCLGILASAHGAEKFTSVSSTKPAAPSRPFISADRHLQDKAAGTLYLNSAFAHGFRHGYEQGFHVGDLDIHMGRSPRIAFKGKEYQPGKHEYNVGFGSHELFDEGYRDGFRAGYGDAISGLEFREKTRFAAVGLDPLPPSRSAYFDHGVASGFESSQSPTASALQLTREYVESYCRRITSGPYPLDYCAGFSRGYLLGMANMPAPSLKPGPPEAAGH